MRTETLQADTTNTQTRICWDTSRTFHTTRTCNIWSSNQAPFDALFTHGQIIN